MNNTACNINDLSKSTDLTMVYLLINISPKNLLLMVSVVVSQGTGAHHMNGIVKCSIGFVSTWTLMKLLHAQAQWPQVINKAFWPFTMQHAVNIYVNCYRGCHGTAVSPIKEFTNMTASLKPHDLHPWGCLVYVLEKCLQDGNHAISKWDTHAWLGVYVSHSTIHSSNVVLVYNLSTGHTTPQFMWCLTTTSKQLLLTSPLYPQL